MGLKDLPLASGARHVAAFARAGWVCVRIKGSHHILQKEGMDPHLSVPCHGKDLSRAVLGKLLKAAGMTEEEYLDHFHKRVPKEKA